MDLSSVFSIASSVFSIFLAIFAIWLAFQQRKESQGSYENTLDALNEMKRVTEKTELLVSENFQNLLTSVTEQQGKMLESLKPRATAEEKYADLFVKLAGEEPEKLNSVVEAIAKIQSAQPKQQSNDSLSQLLALSAAAERRNK